MAGYTPKREGYDLMKKSFLSLFGGQQGQPANRRRLLALLAPLTVLGLAVCICMSPAPADESVYMLIDSESIHTVTADSGAILMYMNVVRLASGKGVTLLSVPSPPGSELVVFVQ